VDNSVKGAILCREKTWWNNNEIFVEEMFVSPELQRQGYGTSLLNAVEFYIKEKGLAGFTLLTNRYTPAPNFYRKNGFSEGEHVLFMYKVA
jgi:aminoglycoside 6'-N-acetyltransferase I